MSNGYDDSMFDEENMDLYDQPDDDFSSGELPEDDDYDYSDDDQQPDLKKKPDGNSSEIDVFDVRDIYKEKIDPLVKELNKICILNKIPYFMTTVVRSTPTRTDYKNDGIMTGSTRIHLYDDKFERFMMICCGAEIRSPHREILNEDDETVMNYLNEMLSQDIDDLDDEESEAEPLVPSDEDMKNPPKDDLQYPKPSGWDEGVDDRGYKTKGNLAVSDTVF